jgi:hypothetical protein
MLLFIRWLSEVETAVVRMSSLDTNNITPTHFLCIVFVSIQIQMNRVLIIIAERLYSLHTYPTTYPFPITYA